METNSIYSQIYNISNLILAWRKAKKGKTKKIYVREFEKDTIENLFTLHEELKNETYLPKPLKIFILRDPKTRKISKADFKDRIVHHAIVNILEPIFDKTFIYDSCANRKGKGSLFAIKRFDEFKRKVSNNGRLINNNFDNNFVEGYCLKADIKHYFQEINHEILLKIIRAKIKDNNLINIIEKVILNGRLDNNQYKGMPLGNLTSQFFANVYLNELDYFIKHNLKAKYYIRYVDDFVILHNSKEQLEIWKEQINQFLDNKLKLELHPEKSKVIPLAKGVDFVGFRNFYHFRLLRKRNIRKMFLVIGQYKQGEIDKENFLEIFQGWQAYAMWADTFNLRNNLFKEI